MLFEQAAKITILAACFVYSYSDYFKSAKKYKKHKNVLVFKLKCLYIYLHV